MATSSVLSKSHGAGPSQRFPCESALEAFGIPFVYYGGDGSRAYTSPAGEALLRSERVGTTLAAQADHAAKELCWSHAPVRARAPAGHLELVRELPCCSDDGIVLALHVTVSASGRFGVVVVIRLSAYTGTARLPTLGLTQREAEVARLIAAGLTTKAIASLLGITTHTTRHHTERVFDKLGVHTRASVARPPFWLLVRWCRTPTPCVPRRRRRLRT